MRRLLGRQRIAETGEANAQRFVEAVTRLAREERVLIFYPYSSLMFGGTNERTGWIWMLNPLWQERVLELLKMAPVRDARFSPPDSLDGWTFTAYSTVPVPRIAKLGLDDIY